MKEVTMVMTCEITSIDTFTDAVVDWIEKNKEAISDSLVKLIKSDLNADHVNVLKIQNFIRDVPN